MRGESILAGSLLQFIQSHTKYLFSAAIFSLAIIHSEVVLSVHFGL